MELVFQQEKIYWIWKKKNILGIAISVLYIGEDDDRETKQCYIWNTNTKEKEQQFCY